MSLYNAHTTTTTTTNTTNDDDDDNIMYNMLCHGLSYDIMQFRLSYYIVAYVFDISVIYIYMRYIDVYIYIYIHT